MDHVASMGWTILSDLVKCAKAQLFMSLCIITALRAEVGREARPGAAASPGAGPA
jgi:hypothetical protein